MEPRPGEGWYRTIFEQAEVGIVHCSLDGRLLRVNRHFALFLGYPVNQLEGKYAREITVDEDYQEELRGIGELLAGRCQRYSADKRYIRKDGVTVWGNLTVTPFINQDGVMEMLLATVQDINARKKAEEALAENLHRYQIIFHNSPLGMIRFDSQGLIVNCNQKFVELMGSSREQVLGFNTARESSPKMREAIAKALAGEAAIYEDTYTSVTGGKSSVLRVVFNPVSPGRSPSEVIATVEDVTERRMAEEVIAHRLISLTRPLTEASTIAFADLFNLDDLQLLQDQFAEAFGVASIITDPDGNPITQPSGFTRLCRDLIRPNAKGYDNCRRSDAVLGRLCTDGPQVQTCLSGGLWDAGAGISVGGRHLANWLIGQVRDGSQSEEAIRLYASEIGIDEEQAAAAFAEVPAMSRERFEGIARLLFSLANRLSTSAYQNLQQARFISELKEAKDQLATSESRLRFALQGANDGLWDADLRGQGEVYFSDRAMDILGYEAMAKTKHEVDWRSLIHPDDFARVWSKVVELFKKKSSILVEEIRLQKQGGGWKWVLVRGKVVSWAEDHWALRLTGTLTDINHRKKIEEAQLFLLDLDRNQDGGDFFHHLATFLAASLGMEFICIDKLSGDQLTAHTLAVLHDGDLHDNLSYSLKDTPCGEVVGQDLCVFPCRVRQLFPKDEVLQEMEAESYLGVTLWGRMGRAIGLIAAISRRPLEERESAEAILKLVAIRAASELERRQAEEEREHLQLQLLQAQKMESVGRLAGGVAHDFNNMLGVILGHVEMIGEQLVDNDPLAHDLKEIKIAAGRSADLTRQLLAFARKQTVSPQVLDLNAIVSGLLKMLKRLIGEDVQLSWVPAHDLWPILLDPTQVDQILANLTLNARDAIAGVGQVVIETANITVDADYCSDHLGMMPGDFVQLTVSDTGCGIDQETRQHIFEPFFTTKAVGSGTGLGLATIYGIVKQNGGYIDVYSEPGRGSTFRIFFPRHRGENSTPQEPASHPPIPGQETILMVEDEPSILTIGQRMLERLGYTVLPAASPSAAETLAASHPGRIDLLITDVIMPEMNGRELAERLAKDRPKMAILFMSGYTADVIAHHGVLDSGVHFIQKPFSRLELAAKVRQAIDGG